jgi:hypothetical protein
MKMKRNQSYFEPTEYGKEIERKVQILDAARFAIDNRQTMGQFTRMADGLFLLLNDRHMTIPELQEYSKAYHQIRSAS